jgi:arylsulfatase A-like enzyme
MAQRQRFFLFVQSMAAMRTRRWPASAAALKQHRLYDPATILLVGDHGEAASACPSMTPPSHSAHRENAEREGAGRRSWRPSQHIDLLPTILDRRRAPEPGGLRGRSLRAVPRR